MDVQWTGADPATGEKRYFRAERFGGRWRFRVRLQRRTEWADFAPTRAHWEVVRETLDRRYRRRDGVDDADRAEVRRVLAEWREPPAVE